MSIYIEDKERGGGMVRSCGYSLQREIVDVLLDENPELSDAEFRTAGGTVVALVLTVEKPKQILLHRLAKELGAHSRHQADQTVAVTMSTPTGPAWRVLSLARLRRLAEDASDLTGQHRLQAALRRRDR